MLKKERKIPTFWPDAVWPSSGYHIQHTCMGITTSLISILHTPNYECLLDNPSNGLSICSTLSVAAQQAANSRPPFLLKHWTYGVRLMYQASLIINFFLLLAQSNTVVSFLSIVRLVVLACPAIADFFRRPLLACILMFLSSFPPISLLSPRCIRFHSCGKYTFGGYFSTAVETYTLGRQ